MNLEEHFLERPIQPRKYNKENDPKNLFKICWK